jgi:malate dehydrogenase (oxaloacetate-decarboxylating)
MKFSIKIDPISGRRYMAVDRKGEHVLSHPLVNKSTAFTERERDELHLNGLLPPGISTIKQQLARVYESFRLKTTPLGRYKHLTALQDRNETLFYRLLQEHIDEMMPVVYTPVVGEACQKFSHIYRKQRGLYISYEQRDHIESLLRNFGRDHVAVIVVTDGERILGLGDQGVGGMGIPIGKLSLYTLCAGVSPNATLPITLDVGTDNEDLLADPLYMGQRHKRIRGEQYQAFVDAFVAAVQKVFPDAVLQWEDFHKGNAIEQLRRFRDKLCTFNDDIQGTAGVVVAGLYSALRLTGQAMRDQRVVFAGAGAAAQGIGDLIVTAMMEDGLTREEAVGQIYTVDSRGLVTQAREGLEEFKALYARPVDQVAGWEVADRERITLLDTVKNARPTVLLGASGTPNTFDEPVVRAMAGINDQPIIFPLSNPTSQAECTPADAIRYSDGRAILATGSPFDPVEYKGERHRIGQGNNAYIFPGVGLGLTVARARRVTDTMFLDAAKALAAQVTEADLAERAIYPELRRIRDCSLAVAAATVRRAVAEGHADEEILEDLEETIRRAMWNPEYLPVRYEP